MAVYAPMGIRIYAGDLPGMFDLYRYFTPHAYLFDVALENHGPPWWNPLSFCGTPLAANPQAAVFYAPNLLRSLLTPGPTPLNAYFGLLAVTAIHSVAAGVGMYFLSRHHRLGVVSSLVAGTLFIFSLGFVRRALAYHFITAVAWFPFVLLFFHVAIVANDTRRRMFYAVGAGLCLGMSILSGFFHISGYLGILMAGYWLCIRLLRLDTPTPDRPSMRGWIVRDVVVLAVIGIVAVAVSAAQLLPSWEYLQYTARSTGTDLEQGMMQSDHSMFDFVQSMIGNPATDPFLSGLRFAGVAIYLFMPFAFLGKRKRDAIAFAALSVALIDCTLGPPLPLATLIDWLTPFKLAYADRAFIVVCIPLALLGALGFEAAQTRTAGSRNRAGAIMVVAGAALLAYLHAFWNVQDTRLLAALICLIAITIFLVLFGHFASYRLHSGVLFSLLLAEIVLWNNHYIPRYLDREHPFTRHDVVASVQPYAPGNARRIEPLPNRHLLRLRPAQNGYDPLYLLDVRNFVCRPDQEHGYDRVLAPSYHIPTQNRRLDLLLKRRFWLTRHIEPGPMPPKSEPFSPTISACVAPDQIQHVDSELRQPAPADAFTSVPLPVVSMAPNVMTGRHDITSWRIPLDGAPTPDERHRLVSLSYDSSTAGLLEVHLKDNTYHEQLLLAVVEIEETEGHPKSISLALPDFPSAGLVVVLQAADDPNSFVLRDAELLTDSLDEDRLIAIASDRLDAVELDIGPLAAARMLVYTDADYSGWQAYVDGVESTVFRTDEVFKGVVVPAGTHRVTFRFRPASVFAGLATSAFALLCILMFLIRTGWMRHREVRST